MQHFGGGFIMEEEKKKKINLWQIATIVFIFLFILALFNVFDYNSSTTRITGNAVGYINDNLLDSNSKAQVVSSERANGVIKVVLNIGGNLMESYISSDGKLLFPSAIPLTGEVVANAQQPSTGVIEVSADDDPFLGSENAPITIVEFSDYQCPYCSKFEETTFLDLKSKYIDTGLIRLVFRDFPLTSIHQYAQKSAEASECADEQGKFWEYHSVLFNNQNALTLADLKKYAVDLKLDATKFDACLDSGKYEDEVQKDMQDGISYGVAGTPAFFVNGKILEGAQPLSEFERLINS